MHFSRDYRVPDREHNFAAILHVRPSGVPQRDITFAQHMYNCHVQSKIWILCYCPTLGLADVTDCVKSDTRNLCVLIDNICTPATVSMLSGNTAIVLIKCVPV